MGANGYSRFNLLGFFRNNNDANLTWEGDNTVLLQQSTKFLIENYKKKLKGKNIDHKVKYYFIIKSLSFLNRVVENNKIRIENSTLLYDFNILRDLFEFRLNTLLKKSHEKLTKNEKNLNAFDNFNDCQLFYFQKATIAYGELYVFNCFVSKINELTANETQEILKQICVLFTLNNLEKDLDILRQDDYIISSTCDQIKEEIINLCDKLKDQLIPILDVIAPRDEILGAPLGYSDGKVNEKYNIKNFDRYIDKVFTHNECFERAPWWQMILDK